MITYASWSFRQSQRRYFTTRREMLAAVTMCNYFRSYLRGAQLTSRTDHQSLRWLQKFAIVTACWPGGICFSGTSRSPSNTARGLSKLILMSSQYGQYLRPDCLVGPPDLVVVDSTSTSDLAEQPLATLAMGDSRDSDLFLGLSGETWVAAMRPSVTCLRLTLI